MGKGPHVACAGDHDKARVGQKRRYPLGNHAGWLWRVFAAHNQHGNMQSGVAGRPGGFFNQRREIKRRLGRPAHKRKLLMRKKNVPRTLSAPVVDKTRGCATVVSHSYACSGFPGNALDFRKRLNSGSADFSEKVECRWL